MNYYNDPYFDSEQVDGILKLKNTMHKEQRPYKCPICEGTGKVQVNGDTTAVLTTACHGCGGNGIVWG